MALQGPLKPIRLNASVPLIKNLQSKFNLNFFVLSIVGWLFSACANPLASVQPDIKAFQHKYPDNFGFVEVENKKVHYAWSGDPAKQLLIFVHGSPGSWKGWSRFLLDEDLQKRFFIIAIDRFGYGNSNRGVTETSLEKQAQAVIEILKLNQRSKKPILVGHSYGGPVIAGVAMLEPQLVGGLVFVASSVSPALEKVKWFQYPASWWPFRYLIPTDLRVCNEEILPLKSELETQTHRWPKIEAKVAIIQGVDDTLVPKENADYIVEHLKKEQIVYFEKTAKLGHFVPWERPDLIIKAIESLVGEAAYK